MTSHEHNHMDSERRLLLEEDGFNLRSILNGFKMDLTDLIVLVLCFFLRRRQKHLQRTRLWVHPILQSRNERGELYSLIQELRLDEDSHKEYFWLSTVEFDRLLTMVAPVIEKQDTTLRQAIGPAERLVICLW